MEDSIHHKQLRQKLMNQLHLKGINSVTVLEAMNKVPRHLFIDTLHSVSECYDDIPLSIGYEQTISQPYTVAYQTSLLNISPRDKILEIGTGSGYQAAILFEMGADVISVERYKQLYDKTHLRLIQLGYSAIKAIYSDGTEGLETQAPYDKILLTAEAKEIPQKLVQQLKAGGIMVLPLQNKMLRITKGLKNEIEIEELGSFNFVPLLSGRVK